ncbi:histidyl-tRNA synthetase [Cylindrobasidium torrendii FP15055 ss-10]|uniref:histidine--tRNA ligase n=1 Tax=Cylindrobasidium torrendii FP15055 ss-10 TaxID=1314674 RepID=A0A0D7B9N2_9AGAR|nr:histidyl-tRNA synthetase [Cylindrobasidium torrendii FP15055 ss-10]
MSSTLAQEVADQNALYNTLRADNGDAAEIEAARKKLGELKKALGQLNAKGKEKKAEGGDDESKKGRLLLKTAKGTRDYGPTEMLCRLHIENTVRNAFTLYGGSCLDTPVFERKDVLTDKYGEDSKLIFDLMDQGGEQLALRYDHTVPLARWLAMTGGGGAGKIWQIGKVYRRDQPVMSKGRMREFMQADFDISGTFDAMIPDAEIVSLVCTILTNLDIGEFTIKMNHRKILDGIFAVCGVPADKTRTISSAVDKLDKLPWADVKKEMTEEKGLDAAVADKIGEYVKYKGGAELLERLQQDATLMANQSAKEGIEEMAILFSYLGAYQVMNRISFDMSLARGLDYYTGLIYEAVVEASAPPAKAANASAAPAKKAKKENADEEEIDESQVGVGSIAAGGRYDNLVGAFTAAAAGDSKKKPPQTPCIGISIGMDRIFALLWPRWVSMGGRAKDTMVYVMAAGDGLLEERMALVRELREQGIKTDFLAKKKPKLPTQFAAGEKDEVPFAVILGADELKEGLVTVKEQVWEFKDGVKSKVKAENEKGTKVKRSELVDLIKSSNAWKTWA